MCCFEFLHVCLLNLYLHERLFFVCLFVYKDDVLYGVSTRVFIKFVATRTNGFCLFTKAMCCFETKELSNHEG